MIKQIWPLMVRAIAITTTICLPASIAAGKTLFLAHYDGDSVAADFAVGSPKPVDVPGQPVAGVTQDSEGCWGKALELREQDGGRCAYDAVKNLDIRHGTVDFWYCFDEDKPNMYHPLFGWHTLQHDSQAPQRNRRPTHLSPGRSGKPAASCW